MVQRKIKSAAVICTAAACLLVGMLFCVFFALKSRGIIILPKCLGSPYADIYDEERLNSRLAEDMTVFGGKLYVGGGDYDANTGPVTVRSYDLERGVWESSDKPLEDEQIKRFRVFGDKLYTLGTDPKGDWSLGNYYVLGEKGWETVRALPSGIHCFDAIEFGSNIFFALGVNSGDYPVARYDGENYEALTFYKNGEPLDTLAHGVVRVYNFFEYGGTLYAFLTLDLTAEDGTVSYFMDLYAYGDGGFEFVSGTLPACDMPDVISTQNGVYFIMNSTLLVTDDLVNFSGISLGSSFRAVDIIEFEGRVYLLGTGKISEGLFESAVFELDGNTPKKLVGVVRDNPAGAFCRDGEMFYISLGRRGEISSAASAGEVLALKAK